MSLEERIIIPLPPAMPIPEPAAPGLRKKPPLPPALPGRVIRFGFEAATAFCGAGCSNVGASRVGAIAPVATT